MNEKQPYICGALTELPLDIRDVVKVFYSRLGEVCHEATGVRGFVPHEHFDPVANAQATPQEVNATERKAGM